MKIIIKEEEENLVYIDVVDCFEQIKLPTSVLITKSGTKVVWLIGIPVHLTSEWVCSTTLIVVEA
jgi:hypothetical protein